MSGDLELVVWGTYRAKRPQRFLSLTMRDCYNDRRIISLDLLRNQVYYDGPAVRMGRRYPKTSVEKFRAWASHRVDPETGEKL